MASLLFSPVNLVEPLLYVVEAVLIRYIIHHLQDGAKAGVKRQTQGEVVKPPLEWPAMQAGCQEAQGG